MKKTLKKETKKLFILFIIIILITSVMPANTVRAGIEESENKIAKEEKLETKDGINLKINSETNITEDGKNTTEISGSGDKTTNEENTNTVYANTIDTNTMDTNTLSVDNDTTTIGEEEKLTENEIKDAKKKVSSKNKSSSSDQDIQTYSASYSDLANFVSEVKLLDQNGNEVKDNINPDATYSIQIVFRETADKQFTVNGRGEMTYLLPKYVKVLRGISEQNIVSSTGIKLGKYSISENGLVTVKWNSVDRDGNSIDELYIDYYNDAFLNLRFDSKISVESIGEEVEIYFGNNITISITFDEKYSLVVNKSAGEYDVATHSIDYEVELSTYGELSNLKLRDILDEDFNLDLKSPIEITYNYNDGSVRKVSINASDYPNSATVNDDGNIKQLSGEEIKEYIEILDGEFILSYKDNGKETVKSQTQIIAKYTTVMKESVITGSTEGVINKEVQNTAIGTGKTTKGVEVENSDTEKVNIVDAILQKSGYLVEKGDSTLNNTEDVILWYIALGDGYSNINGTVIQDTLGEGLTFGKKELCMILLYDKDQNVIRQEYNYLEDTSIQIENNTFTYTVPTDKEYYKCEIYYTTYFDSNVSIGYEGFKNRVESVGPIGEHGTTGEAWVTRDTTGINKKVENIENGDDGIKYNIEMSVPGSYNEKWFYLYDITQISVNVWNGKQYEEKTYYVNYEEFSEYFLKNLKVTATVGGEKIEFVNYNIYPDAPYTYYIIYGGVSNYGQFAMAFNGGDENSIHWNIPEDSTLKISYKVPLNATLYERSGEAKGTIEQYSGETVKNIVEAIARNEVGTGSVAKDQVDATIPEILKKDYEFIDNTNLAKFDIKVNKDEIDLDSKSDTLTIVDTMSPELYLLENTLQINEYNKETKEYDIPITLEYKVTIDPDTNETILEIQIPDEKNIAIQYNALMEGKGIVDVTNLAQIRGVSGSSSKTEYSFEVQNSSAVSGGSATGTDFYLVKYGETPLGNTPLSGVEFELSKANGSGGKTIIATPKTDTNGKIAFENMDEGTYYLRELATLDSTYILLSAPIEIVISSDNTVTVNYAVDGLVKVVTDLENNTVIEVLNRAQRYISVSGSKTWVDYENKWNMRPDFINVNLLANGNKIDAKKVDSSNGWKYEFSNLPKYNSNGEEIVYKITEDEVKGYTTSINGNDITNTLVTTNVSGSKTWIDYENKWNMRPTSINVNLLANGNKIDTQKVDSSNGWKYEFSNLPKYNSNGEEIVYKITEDEVKGYTTSINGNDITNTLVTTNVSGSKTWIDYENKWNMRPTSINVNLLANGNKIDTQKVDSSNGWKYEFSNLPKYNSDGEEIVYTITEDEVKGYTTSIEGYNLVNKVIEPEISNKKPIKKENGKDITPKTGVNNRVDIPMVTLIVSVIGLVIIKRRIDKE